MYKRGLFIYNNNTYTIYELIEPNFYRIDIMDENARYHVDIDKVKFSRYKKRKTYQIGQESLLNALENLRIELANSKLDIKTTTKYEDGSFYKTQTKGEDDTLKSEIIQCNGKVYSETYIKGTSLLMLQTLTYGSDFSITPMNATEYVCTTIDLEDTKDKIPYVPLSVLRARFDIEHIFENDFKVISNVNEGREYLKIFVKEKNLKGIDTETDGLDFNYYSSNKLVGLILSDKDDRSYYFPFAHTEFENLPMSFLDEIIEAVNSIQDEYDEKNWEVYANTGATAHNKKFEMKVFKKYDKKIKIKHDSYEASFLVTPEIRKGLHSLKNIVETEIEHRKYLEFPDIFLDKNNIDFSKLPKDLVTAYACPDSPNTVKVLRKKLKDLPADSRFIYSIETELTEVKADQEFYGFRIDVDKFIIKYNNCMYTINLLQQLIFALTRQPNLKINSPDVLSDLLFNKMKCPVYLRTKKNKASTSSKALLRLSIDNRDEVTDIIKSDIVDKDGNLIIKADALNKAKYPVTLLLIKYREQMKLLTAFFNRVLKSSTGKVMEIRTIEQFEEEEKGRKCCRLFFWINQNGTSTGRQSSPAHQLPKPIKGCILADSDDHDIVNADYRQIELRLTFSMAKQEDLKALCFDDDNDIHRLIATGITGKPIYMIDAATRSKDKNRNFGVVYLISGKGLAAQKYGAGATKKQIKECEDSIYDFYHTYKNIAKFVKNNRTQIEEHGYTKTKFGRYRYFHQIFDPDLPKDKKEALIRQGNNSPVQGTGADIMKIAEVNVNRWIKNKGWDKEVETPQGKYPLVRLMLSAHDEVIISKHNSIPAEEVMDMVKNCMELKIENFAPLYTSMCFVNNWEEGKDDKFDLPTRLRDELMENYKKTGVTFLKDKKNLCKEMIDLIQEFRTKDLVGYMEGLIAKHGEDIDRVAENVNHNSLTHELIARFKQSKEDKEKNGALTHIEAIHYATEMYFEFRKNLDSLTSMPEKEIDSEDMEETSKDMLNEITGLAEELSYVDKDGELHYETENDTGIYEEEDNSYFMFDDEADLINEISCGTRYLVWETFDMYCVDLNTLIQKEANEILKEIYEKYSDPKGFYSVYIRYENKLIDTGMRTQGIAKEYISNLIISKEPKIERV